MSWGTDILGVSEEAVERAIRFHTGYAQRLERELNEPEREPASGWSRVAAHPDRRIRLGVLATARLDAGILSLVHRPGAESLEVLARAQTPYISAGVPFGLLLVGATTDGTSRQVNGFLAARRLQALFWWASRAASAEQASNIPARDALEHPVQLTYLALAFCASTDVARGLREPIGMIIGRLRGRSMAIGPQRAPLGVYLDAVESLAALARDEDSATHLERLGGILARLGEAHASGVARAQRNGYLWQGLRSTVPVLDIDQLLLARLTLRLGGDAARDALTGLVDAGVAGIAARMALELPDAR